MVLHTKAFMASQYAKDFASVNAYVILRSGEPVANVLFKAKGQTRTRSVYVELLGDQRFIGVDVEVEGIKISDTRRFAAIAEAPHNKNAPNYVIESEALAVLRDQMHQYFRATPTNTQPLVRYRMQFSRFYRALTEGLSDHPPFERSWIGACREAGFDVLVVI